MTALVWFRRDLRLQNNPAWAAATRGHDHVTALFVLDPRLWQAAGPVRGPQLAAHLVALDEELGRAGGRLRVVPGDPVSVVGRCDADQVFWNDDYTPYAQHRDGAVAAALGPRAQRFHGSVVHAPGSLLTKTGSPYRVFTPFSRAWAQRRLPEASMPGATTISIDVGGGIPEAGPPLMAGGERAAADRLSEFLDVVDDYVELRDRPDVAGTSRLSADLKFGTISPLDVIAAVGEATPGRAAVVRQICWRDFWAQVMYHLPATVEHPMRPEYESMEWRNDRDEFRAWCRGLTGYPIVDAGMRQLLAEGWMHNRVRMITASFLAKDLLVDWRWGERFFRRYLVDGDLAQNVGNWQWVAGTGADAAPYFRVFNPVTQGRKFDPDGSYVRRYVPELRQLATKLIHAPWEATPLELLGAGITLGDTYPAPLVDHSEARERALETYQAARSRGSA